MVLNILSQEFLKCINRGRFIFILLLLLIIPMIDLGFGILENFTGYDYANMFSDFKNNGTHSTIINHPAWASFLSFGTVFKIPQLLFDWLLPFYVLFLYSDLPVTEYKNGYINAVVTKTSSRKYYIYKNISAFILVFSLMLFVLLLNFAICYAIYRGGESFGRGMLLNEATGLLELEDPANMTDPWERIQFSHPYITYLCFIASTSIVSGVLSVLSMNIAIAFKNILVVYPVTFLIWIVLVVKRSSIIYAIQPFTEHGLKVTLTAIIHLIIITIVFIAVSFFLSGRNRSDVLA